MAATLIILGAAGAAFAAPALPDTLRAEAQYRVWMPSASEPVEYRLRMLSARTPADTLMGISYLIEYTLDGQSGQTQGFSAYLPGALYDYRPGRLREYHADRDGTVFAPGGDRRQGVQYRTQFAGLLPDQLLQRFDAMRSDPAYDVTDATANDGKKITAVRLYQGQATERYTLQLDRQGRPMSYNADTNLDQVSEQSVAIDYMYNTAAATALKLPVDEQALTAAYPEAFDNGRTDGWRLSQLRGQQLPGFSARRLDGDRLTRRADEPLEAPTVVAFLDPAAVTTPKTIASLRRAVDSYPGNLQLWLVVTDNRDDAVRDVVGQLRAGEVVLPGARSLSRLCGVTDSPTLLLCSADGKIEEIIIGLNNQLTDEVIQWSAGH